MELKSKGFIYNFATSFHFSKKFHTEIEYFYGKTKESGKEGHTLFLIPEISFNLYENKWKLFAGLGVAATASRDFGLVFPTANMKLEYKINNRFSINTETVLLPLIQKINFSYYLPY
ncbi:MAG: hypothetical protein HY959_08010 [Ignavibacteriae bacterium]|nr:hypothetical protein [Ignavibacteriota bacterium]